jgi:integrase
VKRIEFILSVFHRDGKQIRYWRRRWLQALLKTGLAQREVDKETGEPKKGGKIIPAVIVHDFRRTAIRALSRAGVSESVAMQLSGHETASVYRRYRIVTGEDLRDAAAKLNAATAKVSAKVAVATGRARR